MEGPQGDCKVPQRAANGRKELQGSQDHKGPQGTRGLLRIHSDLCRPSWPTVVPALSRISPQVKVRVSAGIVLGLATGGYSWIWLWFLCLSLEVPCSLPFRVYEHLETLLEFERSSQKCPRGRSENFVFLDRPGEGGGGNIKDDLPAHINPPDGACGRLQLALYYTPVTLDADRTTLSPHSSSVAETCRTQ